MAVLEIREHGGHRETNMSLAETSRAQARGLPAGADEAATDADVRMLRQLERKILWLSSWMIHNANHIRPNPDGLKVGGHQASCASAVSFMTALFMHALRPQDRIAVKPHAAPVFHAIQYLLGRQTRDKLEDFRGFGGAQAYPSRTKDTDGVDFSTGSVGLGVATTLFASIVQDFVRARLLGQKTGNNESDAGRLVAIMGDAELDEGNVFEALLEGWKHDVQNLWWIIDYNRHSLDGTVNDNLFQKITSFFETVGWKVINIKYGRRLTAAFGGPGGESLRRWVDECPNQLYSALTFKGGSAWRERISADLAGDAGIAEFLDAHDDADLHAIMTNLGGHDMESLLEAFASAENETVPHCFIAYTIKGYGLPLAGHRDNHAGLMTPAQIETLREENRIPAGQEWDPLAGFGTESDAAQAFLDKVPWRRKPMASIKAPLVLKAPLRAPQQKTTSTQAAFGNILNVLAGENSELVGRIVTTSPDVAVSTNLAPWINKRGVFHRETRDDTFQKENVASPLKWRLGPDGQHIELGIAENNLFLMLAALGLSESLFGERLFPVGTVYDPFVNRGLDALIYGCYQDARFMLAGTPSGIALAPEGGAHQSINTPLVGMSVPGLASFEPAYADELAAIMEWGFAHMQRKSGGSVYMRLSTRAIEQPQRTLDDAARDDLIAGAYWLEAPGPDTQTIIACQGAVAPEAVAAQRMLQQAGRGAAILAVTSADRLHAGWLADPAGCHVARLLAPVSEAGLVSVIDGHPAALSWLGAVHGQKIHPLGVTTFGQSATIDDLFRHHAIDTGAIVRAAGG